MKVIRTVFALIVGLIVVAVSVPAIAALFGFAIPELDLLNHLQFLLFFGTLIALILALFVFGLRHWVPILALLAFLSSAVTFVPVWLQTFAARPPAGDAQTIKLVTHNLFGANYDMVRVAAMIAEENPDIIALQEYFPEQVSMLDGLLRVKYPYNVRCEGGRRANIGLYSKIPFDTEMPSGDCPDGPSGQRTAHIIAGFTLPGRAHFNVMTTHMDWPLPIARQRDEFEVTAAAIKALDGPVIVVGDFNSTPWSYALRGFADETGLTRETHGQLTFPELVPTEYRKTMGTIPFLPLDQVFERGLTVHDLHVAKATGSDHLPIAVTFSVATKQLGLPNRQNGRAGY